LDYDVIIAGASFAGLTLANRIRGRILLIDRSDVGALQTSACATLVDVLEKMDCKDSLLKELYTVNWQTCYGSYKFKAFEPFCTFDYKEFCQILFKKFEGEFVKAQIKGYEDGSVVTNKGVFTAPIIVDCTGWRAVLASSIKKDFVDKKELFFGIETVVPYEDHMLSFILDRKIVKDGYAWIFPIDRGSRVGLGGMTNDGRSLSDKLNDFTSVLGVDTGKIQGGYIPVGLRGGVVDKLFLVGDSAGQAFPLTAEGIRQSIYFGQECAEIIQKIIDGDITLKEGLKAYDSIIEECRQIYRRLLWTQNWVQGKKQRFVDLVSRLSCRGSPIQFIQGKYFKTMRIRSH